MRESHLIGYVPLSDITNSYLASMVFALSKFGTVSDCRIRNSLRTIGSRRFDLLVLNWTDNSFVKRSSGKFSIFGFSKEMVKLLLFRLISRRLVFVRHNIFPHSTSSNSGRFIEKLIDFYEFFFDDVWVHSGHLQAIHRSYIPFPMYRIGNSASNKSKTIVRFNNYYVIFGRILRYKKIKEAIEQFPADCNLVVIGSAPDVGYLQEIEGVSSENIAIYPGFISDVEAANILKLSKGMIVANADSDMIVSASVVFAVSIGVTVFAINSPYLTWLGQKFPNNVIREFGSLAALLSNLDDESVIDLDALRNLQLHLNDEGVQQAIESALLKLQL